MAGIGRHIVDPRILSEQVGDPPSESEAAPTTTTAMSAVGHPSLTVNPRHSAYRHTTVDIYSGLATYSFGEPTFQADVDEGVSPLTPVPDTTPRPSIVPSLQNVSSHPSQSSTHSGPHPPSPPASEEPYHPPALFPDDASYHTFGPGTRYNNSHNNDPSSSSSVSIASSRPSSRTSFQSELLSDDEVEIGNFSGGTSPVIFANPLPDIDEDEDPDFRTFTYYAHSLSQERKGSLPMAIPGVPTDTSNCSREGSILTLRRPSRSLDDEYGSHLTGNQDPAAVTPKSEPLSRADWRSIEAQIQAQAQALSEAEQSSQPPDSWYNELGIDPQYIFQARNSEGSIRSFRSSAQYSFMHQPSNSHTSDPSSPRLSSIAPFAIGARRTSTITLQTVNSSDEAFLQHLRKNDGTFGEIEDQWRYRCYRVEFLQKRRKSQHTRSPSNISLSPLPTPTTDLKVLSKTMCIGQLEHWCCPNIGEFKVDRGILKHDSKADQHRLNVRHFQDPLSKNTYARPSTLIHKHSRATAFTIFRSFTLNSVNGQRTGHTHISTSYGVMLAPKKVQEQFTSTKTTRELSTHGLLEDESRGQRGSRMGSQNAPLRDPNDKNKQHPPEEMAKTTTGKGKGKDKSLSSSGDSILKQTSPIGSQDRATPATANTECGIENAASQAALAPVASSSRVQSFQTVGPGISQPMSFMAPVPLTDSAQVSESAGDHIEPSRSNRNQPGSTDSEEERVRTLTTHAEAFGVLDPSAIEHYRSKNNRSDTGSGSSLPFRILRALLGPPKGEGSSPSVGVYNPRWMVTAGRETQAENDRLISDLDDAFKKVGLLHPNSQKSSSKSASKRKPGPDILADVPDDCLYMLLPLWVGEIDKQGSEPDWSETSTTTAVPTQSVPENRHYLLVWYVPWGDSKGKKPEQQQVLLKRSKGSTHTADDGVDGAKSIILTSFRVNARVVHFDDLRHSGVRAPSTGLAISGPAWEAVNDFDLVFPATRQDQRSNASVVCQCHGRNRGFLFDPHGFAQLGLCNVESSGPVSDHDNVIDEPTQSFSFTTIGKAAAEMIWLGCLAVTSFGV
ncbi:hypothetical protein V8B97DRAFT_1865857 [Scleroderma yunnanense]